MSGMGVRYAGGFFGGKSPGGPQPKGQRYPTGWMGGGMRGGLGDIGDDPGNEGGGGGGSDAAAAAEGDAAAAAETGVGMTTEGLTAADIAGTTGMSAEDAAAAAASAATTTNTATTGNEGLSIGIGTAPPADDPAPPPTSPTLDEPTTVNMDVFGRGATATPYGLDTNRGGFGAAVKGALGLDPGTPPVMNPYGKAAVKAVGSSAIPGGGVAIGAGIGAAENAISNHADAMFGPGPHTPAELSTAAADIASQVSVNQTAAQGLSAAEQGGVSAGGMNPFSGPVPRPTIPRPQDSAQPVSPETRSPIISEDVDSRRRSGGFRLGV